VRVTVDEAGQPTYVIDTHAAWGNLEWIPALAELCQGAAALCHGTLALDGGKASREVIERMAQLVNENAGLTVYDVNLRGKYAIRPDKRAVERSQWLKVNEVELEVLEKLNEPLEATVKGTLMERVLVITRGEDGAEVRSSSLRHRGSGPDVKVVDTIGAGDAFTAAMVCLHLEGRPLNECLRFANFYAARVCEFQGATPQVKRTDVEREAFGRLT
jgi:fructokinase